MNERIISYALMLLFDAFVFGGTVWLIVAQDWSVWWFVLAALLSDGANPRPFMEGLKQP